MRRLTSDVGSFEVGECIGTGGMAEVYRARALGEAGFARPVAIKRVLPRLSRNSRFADMFANEARIASLLAHPNIVAVQNFARDTEGQLFLVMELVEGVDTWALLASGGVPVECASYIISEVLRALAYAHACASDGVPLKIVHRDISPQNVLLSWDGAVKVSDFGLAKAMALGEESTAGIVKGKVGYLSPEQVESVPLDGRSDLFSAGVILHELLTGHPLFEGRTDLEVMRKMKTGTIQPPSARNPSVPRALDRVCLRLLERDRERRYPDAEQALLALAQTGTIPQLGGIALSQLLRQRFPERAHGRTSASQIVLPPSYGVDFEDAAEIPTDAVFERPAELDALLEPPRAAPFHEPPPVSTFVRPIAPPTFSSPPPAALPVPKRGSGGTVALLVIAPLLLGGAIAGVALWLTEHQPPVPAPAPAPPPAPPPQLPYVIKVDVTPPDAVIEIDGVAVGTGPLLVLSFPRDGREHQLRVTAKGYKKHESTFDGALEQKIVLEEFRMQPPSMLPPEESEPRR